MAAVAHEAQADVTLRDASSVHFIGVGGAGMSGLAEVLHRQGKGVTGSDLRESAEVEHLRSLGIDVWVGHDARKLDAAERPDVVVVSSAVPAHNEELVLARENDLAVISRARALGQLMADREGVAVAGTHGKTTTTSLVACVLTHAGLAPSVLVGGRPQDGGSGAILGEGPHLVAEADEFDRSFLELEPTVAIVTTIEADHLDTYETYGEIEAAFVEFVSRLREGGRAILCTDDPGVRGLRAKLGTFRLSTYGFANADFVAEDLKLESDRTLFVVRDPHGERSRVELPLLGRHNALNALAAIAAAHAVGVAVGTAAEALRGFGGVHRRFEEVGVYRGARVYDDYAHHPTEVAATLAAARQLTPNGRILAIFQPHLFTRTRDLAEEFGEALLGADHAFLVPIYPAREQPISGVTSELILEAATRHGHPNVVLSSSTEQLQRRLDALVGDGDLVLTMGAGDITAVGRRLVAEGAVG